MGSDAVGDLCLNCKLKRQMDDPGLQFALISEASNFRLRATRTCRSVLRDQEEDKPPVMCEEDVAFLKGFKEACEAVEMALLNMPVTDPEEKQRDDSEHTHIDTYGRFQSDKYPYLPPDKIVISFKDPLAIAALYALAKSYARRDEQLATDIRRRLHSIAREELGVDHLPEPQPGGPDPESEFESAKCPECGSKLLSGSGGSGVKCSKCDYWFCY